MRWAATFKPGNLAAAAHVLILISEAVGADIRMRMFEEPAAALRWVRGEDRPEANVSHKFLNGRVEVRTGDITGLRVDAVVNAANSSLLGGGGVDGAIHRRGGGEILRACQELRETCYPRGLPAGEAVLTTAGKLPARYVIHTVGPVWGRDQQPDTLLASCYKKSLALAANHCAGLGGVSGDFHRRLWLSEGRGGGDRVDRDQRGAVAGRCDRAGVAGVLLGRRPGRVPRQPAVLRPRRRESVGVNSLTEQCP